MKFKKTKKEKKADIGSYGLRSTTLKPDPKGDIKIRYTEAHVIRLDDKKK